VSKRTESAVARHYTRDDLLAVIKEGLVAQGTSLDDVKPSDLSAVDEFHTAGMETTEMAVTMMPVTPGMSVLDIGCGIGGTTRHLAYACQCQTTGIDLTPTYIDVARSLTDLTGLTENCSFQVASALDLPFEDAAFDGAVTFHVAMNIEDRASMYREAHRVLKPGGFLCLFDVMKGPGDGMRYPVPWAETAETSFLRSRDETAAFLTDAGFMVDQEKNLRDFAITFFQNAFARAAKADGPPPLGLHLLTGSNAPEKFQNYAAALDDHQIEPVMMITSRKR